jgi:hypothetical protein
MLLRHPPFIVFSSWRGGYNFMNDYKRNPPSHPYYFQRWILKKKSSLVFCVDQVSVLSIVWWTISINLPILRKFKELQLHDKYFLLQMTMVTSLVRGKRRKMSVTAFQMKLISQIQR